MSSTSVRRVGFVVALVAMSVTAYRFGSEASGSVTPATVVTITPCRLLDTRPLPQNVGARNTPLTATEIATFAVWGSNGNCNIPTTATGIIANVTIVNPTAVGFLTIYPADAPKPNASNVNWPAPSVAIPNLVTVGLSATGAIKVYNNAGTVNVIIDITAYLLPTTSAAVGSRNRISIDQIARLRWDQDPGRGAYFPTGAGPAMAAFDGEYLWITNFTDGTVTRMNPLTGARDDIDTGAGAFGVAYDGTSVWVSNAGGTTITQIDPNSEMVTEFTGFANPIGLAFDGTNLWVANLSIDTVTKFNTITFDRDEFTVGGAPSGLAFDGTNIWVANNTTDNVTRINVATGQKDFFGAGDAPMGVAFDGNAVWVANSGSNNVSKYDPPTGTHHEYPVGAGPFGVVFDGHHVYVSNIDDQSVSKIDPFSGTRVDYPNFAAPHGMVYDGTSIWVTMSTVNFVRRISP